MATLTRKPALFFWTILISYALLSSMPCKAAEANLPSYQINALDWSETEDNYVLMIKGDTIPTYTRYELFNPFRLIIDIADASPAPTMDISSIDSRGPVSSVKGQLLEDKEPYITRIELFLDEDNDYSVDRSGNDIIIKFAKEAMEKQASPTMEAPVPVVAPTSIASAVDEGEIDQPFESAAMEKTENIQAPEESTTAITPAAEVATNAGQASVLYDVEVEKSGNETRVLLKSDGPIIDYKAVKLAKNEKANRPDRMYIDVKNVKISGQIQVKKVGTALSQVRTGARSDGFRIVFDSSLDKLFDYEISEVPEGLLVSIKEPAAATAVIAGLMDDSESLQNMEPVSPEPAIIEQNTDVEDETLTLGGESPEVEEPKTAEAKVQPRPSSPTESDTVAAAFAGYNKQRITVDFYKIDLHNVFRLFGEISNLNIVVDEGVHGSLTLALNDVPWDFALDIILNLKDLQKEERYNTLVISPKSKKFEWPERTLESVEIKADESLNIEQQEAQDSIRISKLQDIPETVVEAKSLIHQAQELERLSNYTGALELYEDAFVKWPENTIIAKRVAALCLVRLGQNAKAVHYAKMALKADPTDYDSALQAAIGLARMKKTDEAEQFFDKATSGEQPPSAALNSYAAFSEEHQKFEKALDLLNRHEDLYGDTLETMISKARIHDKQGNRQLAASEYRTILLSGYEIPADLARYISGRASQAE